MLKCANGVAVLSYVMGQNGSLKGKIEGADDEPADTGNWACFDAGLACMQFCLAAYAKGVSICILGVINNGAIARKIELPEDEKAAALIVYAYEEGEHHQAAAR